MLCHFMALLLISILAASNALGGTRPELSDLSKVSLGMEKTEVIEILGSPWTSRRVNEQDRWTYRFFKKDGKIVSTVYQEIMFKEGKVSYKGDRLSPKISAEEQDEINMQNDINDLEDWKKHLAKPKQAQEEYEQWVRDAKGQNPNAVVPEFKPVK